MSAIKDKTSTVDERTYTVGYKKPPEGSRFRKGKSGNPSGRPKKSENVGTILREVLNELIVVPLKDGQSQTMSKRKALITQHVNRAARDVRTFISLFPNIGAAQSPDSALAEEERLRAEDQERQLKIIRAMTYAE